MYALKYAHLLKDKCGHDTEIYNFYIDMRCFGKGYEEFYKKVQSEGVRMVRGKASRVEEEDGQLTVTAEDTLSDRMVKVPVEMVILCTAMEARSDANEVSRIFGISIGSDGFFQEEHPKLEPVSTPSASYVTRCRWLPAPRLPSLPSPLRSQHSHSAASTLPKPTRRSTTRHPKS